MSVITYQDVQVEYEYFPCQRATAGTIVVLHSLGLSMKESDSFIPYFLSNFNVLRYDMLGHGQSQLPSTPITVDMLVDQLEYMTRKFIKGKFYIIAGPAVGYVASRFCRLCNPSISGLVMISPQPIYLSVEQRQQIIHQVETTMSNGFHSFKQFLLSQFTINQNPSFLASLSTQLNKVAEPVHLGLINSWLSEDFGNDFRYIHTPILVLAGTQDTLFPSSTYGITATYMKAELIMVPNSAHLVLLDNPEASANAALGFIASIESGNRAVHGFTMRKEGIANALYKGFDEAASVTKKTMVVHLLHTFQILIGDVEVTNGWNLRKVKSLFLYLLFHGAVTRDELIDVFWRDVSMPSARNQLRMNLHFLRSLLNQGDSEFLHTDREHVFLQENIQCDARDYIHRLSEGYSHMLSGDLDIQVARSILRISPKRLLTHVYDDWYLNFRDEIETQFIALCQWTSEQLNTLDQKNDAKQYQQMIEKLWS